MEFLYWSEVQRQLTRHLQATGEPYSFYDAVRELWEQGVCHAGDELLEIPTEAWEKADADEIGRLLEQTSVQIDHFTPGFRENQIAKQYSIYKRERAIRPVRVAVDQAIGLHRHSAMEILCVLRGEATLVTEEGTKRIAENSFSMMAPNTDHDVLPSYGAVVITFALSQQVIEDTLYRMLEQDSVISRFFRDSMGREQAGCLVIEDVYPEKVLPFLRGILQEHYREKEYSDTAKEAYLSLLLIHLLRYSGNYQRYEQEERRGTAPILAILKYIQANYRITSLGELAAHFHYEPGYLGKLIKKATGKTYTAIIGELRIEEAKRLLLETDLPVEEVGEQTGFDSPVHFSRSFKNSVGAAPSVYRKQNRT